VDEYDLRQKQLAECDQRLQAYLGACPPGHLPLPMSPIRSRHLLLHRGSGRRERARAATRQNRSLLRRN
jgi:hypothetical protein